MACCRLLTLAVATTAVGKELSPAVLSDDEAHDTHSYLRRKPTCSAEPSAAIPRALHQIWWQGETALPEHFATLRQGWLTRHPEWTHKLWDEASVGALINGTFAWFAPTFHALPSKIQKADAARYAILHAEGGVYADLDVESVAAFDPTLRAASPASLLLFEEPASHWAAHQTVVSNGLIAGAQGHPLLLELLRAVRTVPAVFASTGSHMVQSVLAECDARVHEGSSMCGCYATRSSADYFPLHPGLRRPEEFGSPKAHESATRDLIAALGAGTWPPPEAVTVQYWTVSWIDASIGRLFLDGLAAARAGDTARAEALLFATIWSKWGTQYKYHLSTPELVKARGAFAKSLSYAPDYPFPYYEMGNLHLEGKRNAEASSAFAAAAALQPSSILFRNNLGVARLNQADAEGAAEEFGAVLRLSRGAFSTIRGLAPEQRSWQGANLNLALALRQLERPAEAGHHMRAALQGASFEHARTAYQQLRGWQARGEETARQDAQPPPLEEAEAIFGASLAASGRTREAAVRFAAAHRHAADGGEAHRALRERVAAQMAALAEVWDEDGGRSLEGQPGAPRPHRPPSRTRPSAKTGAKPEAATEQEINFVQTEADGSTRSKTVKLTPAQLEDLKKTGGQGAVDMLSKLKDEV